MAEEARYRPSAPGDGVGNISVADEELDLQSEIVDYVKRWVGEEDKLFFRIGQCNGPTRSATIFAIEAARQMCSGNSGNDTARDLLRMALAELDGK
jgi:hypothetical protein